MNTLITIAAILLVYWRVDVLYQERLICEYKYRFYKLRDELRTAGMIGHIDCTDWVFDFLDTSISKTVKELPNINLLSLLFIRFKNKNKTSISTFTEKLNAKFAEKPEFKEFYNRYGIITQRFIFRRHFLLRGIFKFVNYVTTAPKEFVESCRNKFRLFTRSAIVMPEISTIRNYMNAGPSLNIKTPKGNLAHAH